MKLNKLIIQNFMSVKEATLYLADKGLVSIEGENLDETGSDSNGAGKSTIINAILWCNYGEAGKSIKADSVVNDQVNRDCMVQSYWEENEAIYRITRYRKHRVGKNGVQVEIQQGEDWRDITKAGARTVQEQINGILGQDFLTFRANCFAQQDEALDIPAMTDKELKELLENVLPFEDLNEKYEAATESVNKQKRIIESLQDENNRQQWEISSCKKKGEEALIRYKGYSAEVSDRDAQVDIKIKAKQEGIRLAKTYLTDLHKVQAELEIIKKGITKLGPNVNVAMAEHTVRIYQETYLKRNKEYVEIDNRCPVCKQETESKEALQARLLPALRRAQSDLEKAEKELEEVRKRAVYYNKLEEGRKDLQSKVDAHLESERTIKRLEGEIKLLEGQRLSGAVNPHLDAVRGFKRDYDAAKATSEALTEQLALEQQKLELLEAVQFTYSPKGVRYYMLEAVAPTLTVNTNKYLNLLTDGALTASWSTVVKTATGDYREKFRIETAMMGRDKEYGALSGGEKRKVRLACFFALQDVIASRATKNISLWCGDEIDHALDPAGIERLMSVLDAKTDSKSTILVISHNEMREWIPNVAVVTRKNDVSVITGILNEHD